MKLQTKISKERCNFFILNSSQKRARRRETSPLQNPIYFIVIVNSLSESRKPLNLTLTRTKTVVSGRDSNFERKIQDGDLREPYINRDLRATVEVDGRPNFVQKCTRREENRLVAEQLSRPVVDSCCDCAFCFNFDYGTHYLDYFFPFGKWCGSRREWSSPPDVARRVYSSVFLGSPGEYPVLKSEMESESIYSGLRYDSDFYLTSRTSTAQDGSQWIAPELRQKLPEWDAPRQSIPSSAERIERARAIASLRRVKEIKQFLMSLFLSRSRARNGTLPADIRVAICSWLLRAGGRRAL
ncbi:unnamed protein product [Euphydryas editha]|uniref:Uncharacterized protein n=1 Tax=Euphydryas editha TaxID=104508 RepID=A0AAU9UAJ5_EUPED|nr:unnamed protein product [Euphydryas editha]